MMAPLFNFPISGVPRDDALDDLAVTAEEAATWSAVISRLDDWPERHVTTADAQRLRAVLEMSLPSPSPIRRAVSAHHMAHHSWWSMLVLARTQVNVLRPAFWFASAAIVVLGVVTELAQPSADAAWVARAIGPLLAYLGVATAFRGFGRQTIEYELACPPSLTQVMLARLAIVLGYDCVLGLAISVADWLHGDGSFLLVTLHWLMPLLLVAGLALALSLRLPVSVAASSAYAAWLVVLVLLETYMDPVHAFTMLLGTMGGELCLGMLGLALLGFALFHYPRQVARLLPLH